MANGTDNNSTRTGLWCCYYVLSPIHTADADATQLSMSWVASAVWTHPSAVVTQFTISCAVELLRLLDDIMTSLSRKLSISIKIHVVKPLCSVFKLSTESVGSRGELIANSDIQPTPTRLNSTAESRRRYVLGFTVIARVDLVHAMNAQQRQWVGWSQKSWNIRL